MRVRAKNNLNYDGTWHFTGEEFEIALTDADRLGDMIEIAETPVEENTASGEATVAVRRGRKPKNT